MIVFLFTPFCLSTGKEAHKCFLVLCFLSSIFFYHILSKHLALSLTFSFLFLIYLCFCVDCISKYPPSPKKNPNVFFIRTNIKQSIIVETVSCQLVKVNLLDLFLALRKPIYVPLCQTEHFRKSQKQQKT